MKKIFLLLLLCLYVLGFSQNKFVVGKVESFYYTSDSTYHKVETSKYEVHLYKNNGDPYDTNKVFEGKDSYFTIKIEDTLLKTYDMIEVTSSQG